jgi:hypothetical protein
MITIYKEDMEKISLWRYEKKTLIKKEDEDVEYVHQNYGFV